MSAKSLPRLHWAGRNVVDSHATLAPARLEPSPVSSPSQTLIEGDNLRSLRCLAEEIPRQVTLAYLDPPFLTGREHFHVERTKTKSGSINRTEHRAFDDRWSSLSDYLDTLEPRLRAISSLLAPHGSLILHVDPKTSHYAKIICDEIFGIESFASEVVWRYRRWPSKTKNFQRVHDVMLRYVKDPAAEPRFNQLYEPLAPSTRKTWGDRKQRAVTDPSGKRLKSSKTEEKSRGVPMGDVWEIGIVAPVAKERTGYPTQKPEALLRRWIESCTNEGDLILDPYMGSGTTLSVAYQTRRNAIGIDVGSESHRVASQRLTDLGASFQKRKLTVPLAQTRRPKRKLNSIAS